MSIERVQSGLIQRVTPSTTFNLYRMVDNAPEAKFENYKHATVDPTAPNALEIPDITGGSHYSGNNPFGIFIADEGLDGPDDGSTPPLP